MNTRQRFRNTFLKLSVGGVILGILPLASLAQHITLDNYQGQSEVKASGSIRLLPGFTVPAGATFRAYISGCANLATPSNDSRGYVMSISPKVPGIKQVSQLASLSGCQADQAITYLDGLGRSLQDIAVGASPSGNDVIMPHAYDGFGRSPKQYLPYTTDGISGSFRQNALNAAAGSQSQFYQNPPAGVTQSANGTAVQEVRYEPSPLNRVLEAGSAGTSWQIGSGHTRQVIIETNTINEVSLWAVNTGGAQVAEAAPAGSIQKTTTIDENGKRIIVFQDAQGLIRRKSQPSGLNAFISTDYVYDDFGNLRYIIPPLPSSVTSTTSFSENDVVFKNFIYAYHYDDEQRVIETKIPSKDWSAVVFDRLGRPILARSARQKATGIWIFTKYDALGREVLSGEYKSSLSRNSLQQEADDYTGPLTEQYIAGPLNHGYSAMSYPAIIDPATAKVLKANYYDDYNFLSNSAINPNSQVFQGPSGGVDSLMHRPVGLPTGSRVNVLGTNDYLLQAVHYNQYGKVVQTLAQHFQGGAVSAYKYDESKIGYTFDGKVVKSVRRHFVNASPDPRLTITGKFTYDQAGRPSEIRQAYDGGSEQVVAQYKYNELGQLITKRLHGKSNGAFLQNVDYRYNARGWLNRINRPENLEDENTSGATDAFAVNYSYETPEAGYQVTPQYTGNVSSTTWQSKIPAALNGIIAQESKGYGYEYNLLNQLTSAAYKSASGNDRFNENLTYDGLGNILTLTRTGNSNLINNLSYEYGSGSSLSHLLQSVNDSGSEAYSSAFQYDSNGSLKADTKKQISQIDYNVLNQPSMLNLASGKTVQTYYDADGKKLEMIVRQGTTVLQDHSYIDGIEYDGNDIITVMMPEGRAIPRNGGYQLEYFMTDRLGNVRALVADRNDNGQFDVSTDLLTINDYYAFGRQINYGSQLVTNPENKYLFNGKEFLSDAQQYDYGARLYDPVLGRWGSSDPLAMTMTGYSPYNYAYNNPANFTDPTGMSPESPIPDSRDEYGRYIYDQWTGAFLPESHRSGGWGDPGASMTAALNSISQSQTLWAQYSSNYLTINGVKESNNFSSVQEMIDYSLETRKSTSRLDPIFILGKTYLSTSWWEADKTSFDNFWHNVQKDFNPYALDTRTLNGNIFGLSYPGGDNPKNYKGEDDFSYLPANVIEWPAIQHDHDYDRVGAKGANGLLYDARVIRADYQFVARSFGAALIAPNPLHKVEGALLGIGLGIIAAPKTIYHYIITPYLQSGFGQIGPGTR